MSAGVFSCQGSIHKQQSDVHHLFIRIQSLFTKLIIGTFVTSKFDNVVSET